jgi:hypothetical protein
MESNLPSFLGCVLCEGWEAMSLDLLNPWIFPQNGELNISSRRTKLLYFDSHLPTTRNELYSHMLTETAHILNTVTKYLIDGDRN